jgi:hypothetical protein
MLSSLWMLMLVLIFHSGVARLAKPKAVPEPYVAHWVDGKVLLREPRNEMCPAALQAHHTKDLMHGGSASPAAMQACCVLDKSLVVMELIYDLMKCDAIRRSSQGLAEFGDVNMRHITAAVRQQTGIDALCDTKSVENFYQSMVTCCNLHQHSVCVSMMDSLDLIRWMVQMKDSVKECKNDSQLGTTPLDSTGACQTATNSSSKVVYSLLEMASSMYANLDTEAFLTNPMINHLLHLCGTRHGCLSDVIAYIDDQVYRDPCFKSTSASCSEINLPTPNPTPAPTLTPTPLPTGVPTTEPTQSPTQHPTPPTPAPTKDTSSPAYLSKLRGRNFKKKVCRRSTCHGGLTTPPMIDAVASEPTHSCGYDGTWKKCVCWCWYPKTAKEQREVPAPTTSPTPAPTPRYMAFPSYCDKGHYGKQDENKIVICYRCPIGKYQSSKNEYACPVCPPGKHQTKTTGVNCSVVAGYAASRNFMKPLIGPWWSQHNKTSAPTASPTFPHPTFKSLAPTHKPTPKPTPQVNPDCLAGNFATHDSYGWSCQECPVGKYQVPFSVGVLLTACS